MRICYTTIMEEIAFFKAIQTRAVAGAYYLHGQEEYSKAHAIRQCNTLLSEGMAELNRQTLQNPTAADVMQACETLPMFDERRIVTVKELSSDDAEKLIPYLDKVPESTLLLIVKRGEDAKKSAFFKTMAQLDRVVTFEAYSEERAMAFIEKRAKLVGASVGRVAARKLVTMVGTDLSELENAVNMASAYVNYGEITAAALETCVTPDAEYNAFQMVDLLVAGKKKQAITMLLSRLQDGESAMSIAAFLEGRLKLILRAKQYVAAGQSDQRAAASLGGSPYAAKLAVQNAKRCSMSQLEKAVLSLADVDLLQRQGKRKDVDSLLLAVLGSF